MKKLTDIVAQEAKRSRSFYIAVQQAKRPGGFFSRFCSARAGLHYEPDDDKKNKIYSDALDKLRKDKMSRRVQENFEKWRKDGFKPNQETFSHLLMGLLDGGETQKFTTAKGYLREMSQKFGEDKEWLRGQYKYVLFYCNQAKKKGSVQQLLAEAEDQELGVKREDYEL